MNDASIQRIGAIAYSHSQVFDVTQYAAAKAKASRAHGGDPQRYDPERTNLPVTLILPIPKGVKRMGPIRQLIEKRDDCPERVEFARETPQSPWSPVFAWASESYYSSPTRALFESELSALVADVLCGSLYAPVLMTLHEQFPGSTLHCAFERCCDFEYGFEYVDYQIKVRAFLPAGDSIRDPQQFLRGIAKVCSESVVVAGLVTPG